MRGLSTTSSLRRVYTHDMTTFSGNMSGPEKRAAYQTGYPAGEAQWRWDHYERGFAAQVIENVRYFKKRGRLTAQVLADRVTAAGWPINVNTINGMLGSKKRASISVTEWLALARALGVPPMALLVPLFEQKQVEAYPERDLLPIELLHAILGEGEPAIAGPPDENWSWHVLHQVLGHLSLLRSLRNSLAAADTISMLSLPDSVKESRREEVVQLTSGLAEARRHLEAAGVRLPELEEPLRWIMHVDPKDITFAAILEAYSLYAPREG